MNNLHNTHGSVCYNGKGGRLTETKEFTGVDMFNALTHPRTGGVLYFIVIHDDNGTASYILDPCDKDGVTLGDQKYFGKNLRDLYMAVKNSETEQILDTL